jgi:triacylglycerol esterase/lipase EstA (alpha/beta hydrolase family)
VLAALSPARRRFVLMLCGLVALGLATGIAVVAASRDRPVTPVSQDAQGPVLLVPGYGGSRSALDVLGGALRQAGRDVTVVRLAGDGTGDLREQAQVLDEAVRHALDRTGAPSVDLVGYSAGGVTVRLWMRDFRGGDVTRRILTLGSPHHGTELAALAAD